MTGPLHGLKVVEFPSIGPAPFCGMMLADLGAEVLKLDRAGGGGPGIAFDPKFDLLARGKRSLAIDLKSRGGLELVLSIIDKADVLIEGMRPGAMERLSLGPDAVLQRNPRLIYGRMTGWGQDGPLARAAGHDLNYLALTGALHAIGRKGERPVPPLSLAADFGGGGMYLLAGLLAALLERQRSDQGQVVDAAMVDGASSLMTSFYGMLAAGLWHDERGVNFGDGAAPWYDSYCCSDGRYVCVGALEANFFAELMRCLGIDSASFPDHMDPTCWPQMRVAMTDVFLGKTRAEWCEALEGSDVCFAPVMSMTEAPKHPHLAARSTFVERFGVVQPAPAPRFSRTHASLGHPPPNRGEGGQALLRAWGINVQ